MSTINGKDYSQYQGEVDWAAEHAAGVEFAIIRATFGVSGVDAQFARNQAEVRRLGIPHGWYHFADQSGTATAQVDHFINTVGTFEPGESGWLDQEVAALGRAFWDEGLLHFHARCGFPMGGYASESYFSSHGLDDPANDGAWEAAWSATAPPPPHGWEFWSIWQNSDSGTSVEVGGARVRCDTDIFNGDVAAFLRYGAPGAVTPAPAPVAPPAPPTAPAVGPTSYVVLANDSLWGIAVKESPTHNGAEWPTLYHCGNNATVIGPNPAAIKAGQVLSIPAGWGAGSTIHSSPPAPGRVYRVVAGDNLSAIAAKEGVSLGALEAANRWIVARTGSFNVIQPGWLLAVP